MSNILKMPLKKRKRPNAQKHGIYSASPLLEGEDPEEFRRLAISLIVEWNPEGASETELVTSIATAIWRKRRARKFQQDRLLKKRFDPTDPGYDEDLVLKLLAIALRIDPEKAFDYSRRVLRKEKIAYFEKKYPATTRLEKRAERICREIDATATQAPDATPQEIIKSGNLMTSFAGLTPELIQQELDLDEQLDAMRDRAIKQLVQVKAMKQMLNSNPSKI